MLRKRIRYPKEIKFNGKIYVWNGKYYFANNSYTSSLHRAVWEFHKGPIPKNHHIHYIDENPKNNKLENLECLLFSCHMSSHMQTEERKEKARFALKKYAQPKAVEWHKSEEGRKWHSEHAKGKKEKKFERICKNCDKKYLVAKRKKNQGYCSGRCKTASIYAERKKTSPIRVCEVCNKEFRQSGQYKKDKVQRFCSMECYYKAGKRKPSLFRKCPVCNEEFPILYPSHSKKYCSKRCRSKNNKDNS